MILKRLGDPSQQQQVVDPSRIRLDKLAGAGQREPGLLHDEQARRAAAGGMAIALQGPGFKHRLQQPGLFPATRERTGLGVGLKPGVRSFVEGTL